MSHGYVYTYLRYYTVNRVSLLVGSYGTIEVFYILAWGFSVARFNRQGNAKASEREASDNARLHAFFMSTINCRNSKVICRQ